MHINLFLIFFQVSLSPNYHRRTVLCRMYSWLNKVPSSRSGTERTDPVHVTIHVIKCCYLPQGDLYILNSVTH
jgi:hypothetical protein